MIMRLLATITATCALAVSASAQNFTVTNFLQ